MVCTRFAFAADHWLVAVEVSANEYVQLTLGHSKINHYQDYSGRKLLQETVPVYAMRWYSVWFMHARTVGHGRPAHMLALKSGFWKFGLPGCM